MARLRLSEQQKLSTALNELHQVLGSARGVVRGAQLKALTRRLLIEKGFIREILKGWYFVSDPNATLGDTTPFFANYWEYLATYLSERFGDRYCLTAEHSLLRHAQHNVIPQQVNVMLATSLSQIQELAFGHSLAMYPAGKNFPAVEYRETIMGIQCLSAPYTLVTLTPRYFKTHARDIQIVMRNIHDPSQIAALVDINTTGVGRLIGAYRKIGQTDVAEGIVRQLSGLNIAITIDDDPFDGKTLHSISSVNRSPLYARIKLLWAQHRQAVLDVKPEPLSSLLDHAGYLRQIETIKLEDTYHSLSIERYRVTPELIKKVALGQWNPLNDSGDQRQIDAMAARGYLDAFQWVQEDAGTAFSDESVAATLFAHRHQGWYQKLFGPSVDAGILERTDLVGYRRHLVFLRGSLHVPPHYDHVRDGMEALKSCFAEETDAFVRAVLGHWLIGFIHPYMDGNGRLARFTMNFMLASGRYAWTIIHVEDRATYMDALEKASVEDDIAPFAAFVAQCVKASSMQFF